MKGVVETLFFGKGYGFIRDDDNRTRFFHIRNSYDFERMYVGLRVEFTPIKSTKSDNRHNQLQAIEVRKCKV